MKPTNKGQIVKFSQPLEDGDEEARFLILEINGDRALVQALGTGMEIPPSSTYMVEELEVVDDVKDPKNKEDAQKVMSELKRLIKLFIEQCDPKVTPQICVASKTPDGYAMIEAAIINKVKRSGMPVGSAMAELDNELQRAYE